MDLLNGKVAAKMWDDLTKAYFAGPNIHDLAVASRKERAMGNKYVGCPPSGKKSMPKGGRKK